MMITYGILVLLAVMGQTSGLGPNIARGGTAAQSSNYDYAFAARAIDGNSGTDFKKGSCSHTKYDVRPWWRVDLHETYEVSHVTITNRGDCCQTRINGAEIRIGNSLKDNGNANPRCAVIRAIPLGASQTFKCDGMEGRYVNIVIPTRVSFLTLCEVEVFGKLSDVDDVWGYYSDNP